MTFDRLWSVYLENKLKIKRNKKTVTILIFIVLCFVFVVDQVYMAYYVQNKRYPVYVFNMTLNKSLLVFITVATCVQNNKTLVVAQDMMFVLMRVIVPFIIMVFCNFILIKHIRESRKRVIRGQNQKRENSFTLAVAIMNGSFLFFNIWVIPYYIIVYYSTFSGISLTSVPYAISLLYGTCSILISYLFTLSQFIIDMIFNKVFRKEILVSCLIVTGRGNRVEGTRSGNTQTHNSVN